MINLSTIMSQVQQWLITDSALNGFTVTRSEKFNDDPNCAANGWIGIYRRNVSYNPRNLGDVPNNYEGDIDFLIAVQRISLKSGEHCEDLLEDSTKRVLDRVVQIPRTYIDHFSEIDIEYTYLEAEEKTLYHQGSLITFTADVSFEVK